MIGDRILFLFLLFLFCLFLPCFYFHRASGLCRLWFDLLPLPTGLSGIPYPAQISSHRRQCDREALFDFWLFLIIFIFISFVLFTFFSDPSSWGRPDPWLFRLTVSIQEQYGLRPCRGSAKFLQSYSVEYAEGKVAPWYHHQRQGSIVSF